MSDSDRKYRQRGYLDSPGGTKGEKPRKPRSPADRVGPKPVQMPGSRTVSRCAQCGTLLSAPGEAAATCTKCGAELHACTQCAYFDPGSRFQCARPIEAAIADKTARNECALYALRTTVERDVSSSTTRTSDAVKGFEDLFKK
jgi:hypothetical protein